MIINFRRKTTMEELTLEKFEEASEIVKEVTLETKLIYSEYFSAQTGNKVYFKPENMQYTGAYKVRRRKGPRNPTKSTALAASRIFPKQSPSPTRQSGTITTHSASRHRTTRPFSAG